MKRYLPRKGSSLRLVFNNFVKPHKIESWLINFFNIIVIEFNHIYHSLFSFQHQPLYIIGPKILKVWIDKNACHLNDESAAIECWAWKIDIKLESYER